MGVADTRPPLFDPDPGDGPSKGKKPKSGQFPHKPGKRARSGSRADGGDDDSPAWVRPFIFGGLILVALVSLVSIFASDDDQPDAVATADSATEIAAGVAPSAASVAEEGEQPDGEPADDAAGQSQSDGTTPAVDTSAVDTSAGGTSGEMNLALPTGATITGAEAFAVQFAYDYLNLDPENPDVRETKLAAYLAPGLDPQLGWSGEGTQLAFLTMPVATAPTERGLRVVVASQVSGPGATRWVHLAVPLAADDAGRWAVIAPPAFVARPKGGEPDIQQTPTDEALSDELDPIVRPLFEAFAERAEVQLDGITAPGAAIAGLDGQVSLRSAGTLRVIDGDADRRQARVNITWTQEAIGADITQTYTLTLVSVAGDWLVEAISAE